MTVLELLKTEFEYEMTSTRKVLERVPADKFAWRPHAKSMSLARLASHVATLPMWASTMVDEGPEDGEEVAVLEPACPTSSAELLACFERSACQGRDYLYGLSDDDLARPWTLLVREQDVCAMTRAEVLRMAIMNHLAHHRGQLIVYLRMLDVPVPGIYGPSADDESAYA